MSTNTLFVTDFSNSCQNFQSRELVTVNIGQDVRTGYQTKFHLKRKLQEQRTITL